MANYDINYDDARFTKVESEKTEALSQLDKTYDGMINNSDKFYQQQIDASKAWEKKQSQLQQEKTDFTIEKIEQNKAQAKKDYTKEQSGAYVDWRKQSNEYGVNAEEMASAGLTNTGFSESSQVSMYNTYQNRVATARESYNLAIQNYNNSITEARLQNNSVLAEIAYEALQKQLELSLQGFQYKNTLILEKADKKTEVERDYYNRYQDVLNQINTENALAEEIRQFNEQMAFEREQFNYKKQQGAAAGGGGGGGSSKASIKTSQSQEKTGKSIHGNSGALPKETAQSIMDLGGPYSAKTVDNMVNSGQVYETTSKSGNPVFKENTAMNRSLDYMSSGVALASTSKKKEEKSWKNLWGLLD
jgi:hypothetical protein